MKHYDFIEIGTSDFDTLIESSDDNMVGLSIEPIKYYLDRLPNKKNVKKIQLAVSDVDGDIDIYYIPDEKIKEHDLKWWIRGSNSVNRPHPFAIKELGEELYNSIVKIDKVPTVSWKTLVQSEEVGSIGYLKIDTEGYDHVILNDYLDMCEKLPILFADKIKFEKHPNVSNIEEINKLLQRFKNYQISYNETDVVLTKIKIPKIIHQTFRTKELPKEIENTVDNLKKMNPDFEYRFYDDEDCYNFIKEHYDDETLSLYLSINPNYGSCRADFFRYLLIYKIGGVYLDIKSSTSRPLSETILPTDEYLLSHWIGKDWNELLEYQLGEFQNWHIISVPNHPFLKQTIELVKENIRNYDGQKGKKAVLHLTGPVAYSKAILSLIDDYRFYRVDSPVREFQIENEINLIYNGAITYHGYLYGTNVSKEEFIIMNPNSKESLKHFNELIQYCSENNKFYKEEVRDFIIANIPLDSKILDVGPGKGTYSDLLRQFGYQMDCIEIWEPYVSEFNLQEKYDNVFIGDICDFDFSEYDFLILGDVLDHLTEVQAVDLIDRIHFKFKTCLVGVHYLMKQSECFGNKYEAHHQYDLTPKVMSSRYPKLNMIYSNDEYGYYFTDKYQSKSDKAFVLYCTENYLDVVTMCVKSIRRYSGIPIIVYLINSNKKINVDDVTVIRWDCDIDQPDENSYLSVEGNFYIDRKNPTIYKILIQRPLIIKDALQKYAHNVCYVDSDSVATPLVDTIFFYYDRKSPFPYFVEGVYEYLTYNGRGKGGPLGGELCDTLEHNACELFSVDQSVRKLYRQTGYFVAGQNTLDFLDEWYWMCKHPKIEKDISHYAPYDEETILNVLLWKYKIDIGLPYLYVNGTLETVKKMFTQVEYKGPDVLNFLGDWLRAPSIKEQVLFFHGEKDPEIMEMMMHDIQKYFYIRKYEYIKPENNWGDIVSKHILTHFSQKSLEDTDVFYFDTESQMIEKNGKILSVGSNLLFSKPNDYVWGSGCLDPYSIGDIPQKVYAVRGPLTRNCLLKNGWDVPNVFGDPALLFPKKYNPNIEKRYKYGVIPHYSDFQSGLCLKTINQLEDLGVKIVNITAGIYEFIDQLLECELILSSSLHGLIVSDAYGVPNHYVNLGKNLIGGEFKFMDYFASVNRDFYSATNLTSDVYYTTLSELNFEVGDTSISENLLINSPWNDKNNEFFSDEFSKKIRVLYLAPHLSTGGMPAYLLKRIQSLQKNYPEIEIYVVEYCLYSSTYTVQRDIIKNIIPENRFWTLNSLGNNNDTDSLKIIDIIKRNNIDIVHVDEMIEGFDSFNKVSGTVMKALYDNNRTWRMVETCHNIWFKPELMKKYDPDGYAFCTPFHEQQTFKNVPSLTEVMEFPIENKFRTKEEQTNAQMELDFDPTKIHVLNVGLWSQGKNQKEAIDIARYFQSEGVEFHFVGNQAPNFEEYWKPLMLNLPSNVHIWGERGDIETFMKASDVFIFNSTWECNPLVVREAASYGLKIICRNLPQYMEMFDPFIVNLEEDLERNVQILQDLISSERKYNETKGSLEKFADTHYIFYKKIMSNEIKKNNMIDPNISITQYFINQPFLEIKGESDSEFNIMLFDEENYCHYQNFVKSNHWIKLNREYFTRWRTKIFENGDLIYDKTLDYTGLRVFINFDSKSLGDNIAWLPYVEKFKEVHQCDVTVCTYWNKLFKDVYPNLEFVEPGSIVHGIFGQYNLGWFYDLNKEPTLPNTIPLQKAATNILGLPFEEIRPRISFVPKDNPYDTKYITIATNSTAGCKFWTREGWQELINHLTSIGYKVINVSKEDNAFDNCEKIIDTSIENTMNVIYHSDFFIGLSSGLSWLSWALGKHVVMISNFTEKDHEFTSNCTRITNPNVCNSCWNNADFKFDRGDWNWCPLHKGTSRQFECHTSITSKMVINQIQNLLV